MKKLLNKKGQFTIIASLLVSIVLVTAIITTYSIIRNNPTQGRPEILGAIDEMDLAIDRVLEFVVGYYGSILQVTGNTTYAKGLASDYLQSSLENIAYTHPQWSPSFTVGYSRVSASWFSRTSSSEGVLNITYSLMGLGIENIHYAASVGLIVTVNPSSTNNILVNVTCDNDHPCSTLNSNNFFFYNYSYAESAWELNNTGLLINSIVSTDTSSAYNITLPAGIDPSSYMLQTIDPRGIMVTASTFSHYKYTFSWNQALYSALSQDTLVVEALQNGTLRWLGQNLQLTTTGKPIPPIPVKAFHVNQTVNGVNREVPFQVEDWGSNYRVPAGLTSNASVFGNRQMFVFLVNHNIDNVILWWDGRDAANQTSYAYTNRYFTNDDPDDGILTNGDLTLIFQTSYLYVDGFDGTNQAWTEYGASPYLNDDTTNYISHNVDGGVERWFSFGDLTIAQVLAFPAKITVRIEFECSRSGDDYFQFRIHDGTTTSSYYSITPGGSYDWRSYDVTSILDTTTKISNARVELTYRRSGSIGSAVNIRRVRLTIDLGGWLTSVKGTTKAKADFMRINSPPPTYGSNLAYIIHHGIVRDVIHQEAEWSGGITNCPDVYSQIIITLPANATYYTYQLRLMFVQTQRTRTISDLCPIKITATSGQQQTENGTLSGYPIVSNAAGTFYNYSASAWAHHWSQFISGTQGVGIMFTTSANQKLYVFDSIAGSKTGAIRTNSVAKTIEFNPVERYDAAFTNALDVTWHGAVVTFNDEPIYPTTGTAGLWVMVEAPPTVAVSSDS